MTDPSARPSFVQDLLAKDTRAVPGALRTDPRRDLGLAGVPRERYTSKEYADLEARELWPKVWQMACREEQIPNVGDRVVYEVAGMSYVVLRAEGIIHAFVNSCLHRGTQLVSEDGNAQALRCPFHGFTWSLEGELTLVPCEWDFPHVDPAEWSLPEAQVDTWRGFVFINPDPAAGSLTEYLGGLVAHFEPWPLEDRYLIANAAMVVDCNWKVAMEAFLEAFHTWVVHPQLLKSSGDTQTQYDVFEGQPHWSRMITPVGISSEHIRRDMSEQDIVYAMAMARDDPRAIVPEGGTARALLADRVRENLTERSGHDWSHISDSEALDGIEYFVFPNFVPWAGFTTPLVYRFRPLDAPNRSLLEIMALEPVPATGPRPAPAPQRLLGPGEGFGDVPEFGVLGKILDQDLSNFARIQRGLEASAGPDVTFSRYQEVRLRHFHQVLGDYVGR
ncbi:MAG: SRPBCC family protein [Acidimicrobiia bacterium]